MTPNEQLNSFRRRHARTQNKMKRLPPAAYKFITLVGIFWLLLAGTVSIRHLLNRPPSMADLAASNSMHANQHQHQWTAWGQIQVAGGWYRWRRCLECGLAEMEYWRDWTPEEAAMIATNASPKFMDGYLTALSKLGTFKVVSPSSTNVLTAASIIKASSESELAVYDTMQHAWDEGYRFGVLEAQKISLLSNHALFNFSNLDQLVETGHA